MTTQAIICGIAGAIYCSTDIIIMEKYKDCTNNTDYLKVTITIDDVIEKSAIYEMDKVPEYLQNIYEYVRQTSIIEYDKKTEIYTLFGDHIARARGYKFVLGKFPVNPLSSEKTYTLPLSEINSVEVLDETLVNISNKIKQN
jgi:hypothetical protein